MSYMQASIDEIKEESKQTAVEIAEVLCILKDFKQDQKGKNHTYHAKSTFHGLKKLLGKNK